MTTTPYWLGGKTELAVPAATRRGETDVTIIGAGVTGLSCALTLARGGMAVRVVDTRGVAAGASGRNGGFALRGGTPAYDEAVASLGREHAQGLWRLTETAFARMLELGGDAFRRVGSIRLAASDDELEAIEREYAALTADGFVVERVARLEPPLDRLYAGAIHHPGDAGFNPAVWMERLAAHAVEAGAEIVADTVNPEALPEGTVVIAVDAHTSKLLPELADAVQPARGQMLATAPLPAVRYGVPYYARDGYDYWQQLPDGTLLVGGCRDHAFAAEASADDDVTSTVQSGIERLLVNLVGRAPTITHRWSGAWGETLDRLPLCGPVPGRGGVWVAGGYSGHGNILGFACGELIGKALLGDVRRELRLFDPRRPSLSQRA
ncbi:unannotated protein [freshwater metagenome]|uniref:Unannotated protein n=1 Tax=freshwater metagenome TaxID=449393 RepID=A0A6J6NZ04_9ZZZZ